MRLILYLDPGSGSLLLQLVLAGVAGIGITISASWKKIMSLFGRRSRNE